jgi:hypothetical protein
MSKLAEAWVEVRLDTKKAKAQGKGEVDGLGKDLGSSFATAFGAAALGAGIAKSVGAASDLNETVSKTQVIFGESGKKITAWADNSAKQFGLSKTAALDAAGTFAVFGKGAGLAGDDLDNFSTKLVGLSSDLASFYNTSPQQAIDAIGAALRGESEPIRQYGVLLGGATLKQEAMTQGLYNGKGVLDQHARVLAAQAVILKQTSDAQGDFARTADGAANSERIAKAAAEDAAASLGQNFLPIYKRIVQIVGDAATAFGKLPGPIQLSVLALGALVVLAKPLLATKDLFKDLVTVVKKAWEASDGAGFSFGSLGSALVIAGAAAGVALLVYKALSDEKRRLKQITDDYVTALGEEATGQKDAVNAVTAKRLADDKLLDTGKKLGLSTKNLVDVVNGESIPAYKAVREELDKLIKQPADIATKKLGDEFGITLGQAQNFRYGIDELTTGLDQATDKTSAQTQAARDLSEATGEAHRETAALTRETNDLADATAALAARTDPRQEAMIQQAVLAKAATAAAAERAKTASKALTDQLDDETKAFGEVNTAADELTKALDLLFGGTLNAEAANRDYQAGLDTIKDSFKENGKTLDINTEKGRNNRAMIDDNIKSIFSLAEANVANGQSTKDASSSVQLMIADLQNQLTAAGYSKQAIADYIAQLNLTPDNISTAIAVTNDDVARQKIGDLIGQMDYLGEGTIANIQALVDQGSVQRALAILDGIARTRKALFDVNTFDSKVNGTRAGGGPTWAGGKFEVNERGRPELYTEGGHTYLLPGGNGQVTPMPAGGATTKSVIFNGDIINTTDMDGAWRMANFLLAGLN